MIVSTLKRMGWALLLLAIQVLVLDQVHPWGYGAPLLCPLLVITLPLGTARSEALLWGFGIGFVADIFAGTAGISSAAMTLIPRDSEEELHPSFSTMGRWNYLQFIALLLLLHHTIFFALEGFSYFHIKDIAISMGVSYAASLLLIILVEHVRNPQK